MVPLLLLLCSLCLGAHTKHVIEESDLTVEDYGTDTEDDIFKLYDITFFPEETGLHQRNKRYAQAQTTLCLMTFNIENYYSGPDNRNRNQALASVSVKTVAWITIQQCGIWWWYNLSPCWTSQILTMDNIARRTGSEKRITGLNAGFGGSACVYISKTSGLEWNCKTWGSRPIQRYKMWASE